ncbi:MAG TPA: RNA polymerase sigma factor [Polyangia bacterium]
MPVALVGGRSPERTLDGCLAPRLEAQASPRQIVRFSPVDLAMDRYAEGDDAAFAEVYDLLAPRLMSYLLRQTRDPARAEDLVQQTMLQLHRQRGRFIRGSEVRPWAFAIARRYLIDSIRAEKRQRATMEGLSLQEPPPASSVEDLVNSKQMAKRVADELARLPHMQRVALELIRHDGLSVGEAAQVLGTTTNAIKLRIHRAYAALQAAVASPDVTVADAA